MIKEFNDNWQFSSDQGAGWEDVTLPHDAQMTLERSKDAAGGSATAFFPGGSFRYRRNLRLTKEEAEGHVTLRFGGVYKDAEVRINGMKAGGCAYGYLPFAVSGDRLLKEGDNTIEVSCSNEKQPDSRWYSGAGIYRPVRIELQGQTRILSDSIRIRTKSVDDGQGNAVLGIAAATEPAEAVKGLEITVRPEDGKTVTAETAVRPEMGETAKTPESTAGSETEKTAKKSAEITVRPEQEGSKGQDSGNWEVVIPAAKLWSAEEPNLYRFTFVLKNADGTEADRAEVTYGIRELRTSREGLFINGKQALLRGGCIHADNGILGSREYREAAYRRVRKLKEYGFNAIRSAHNPISYELLDACDHLGMYIMDETWDMWYRKKNKYDYGNEFENHYQEDIKAIVQKDYNHPSVILYSIGNEVSEPAEKKGVELGREMTELFHKEDSSRPVTGGFNLMIIKQSAKGKGIYNDDGGRKEDGQEKMNGMNSTMFNLITSMVGTGMNKAANGKKADKITSPILDAVDIAGYNYASGRYKKEGKLHPDRLIVGSETFPQDIAKNWAMVKELPWLVGDFMWSAWDYIGEAGIGTWSISEDAKGFDKPYPWLLGDVGALDILGDPNGEAFWADSVWNRRTSLAVRPVNENPKKLIKGTWRGTNAIPSWSFSGCEGSPAVAEIYTAAPYAALYLNGKRVGKKKVKNNRAVFKLTYEPGELKAVPLDAFGKEWKEADSISDGEAFGAGVKSRRVLRSAGKDLGIRVVPEIEMENALSVSEGLNNADSGRKPNAAAGSTNTVHPGTLVYVDIAIADSKGIVESNCDRNLQIQVQGARLLGFGSANPRTEDRFDNGEYHTWRGKALAAVYISDEAKKGEQISVQVTDVTGDGKTLPEGRLDLAVD